MDCVYDMLFAVTRKLGPGCREPQGTPSILRETADRKLGCVKAGERLAPGAIKSGRRMAGENAKCIAYHAKEIPLVFLFRLGSHYHLASTSVCDSSFRLVSEKSKPRLEEICKTPRER